jgi:hypothetical protein
MSPATRQHFRETLAALADKARAVLPPSVNGRIESAVALVLAGDVEPQPDGTITVYSTTDAMRRYVLTGLTCTCTDYTSGKAPGSWCKHRIGSCTSPVRIIVSPRKPGKMPP